VSLNTYSDDFSIKFGIIFIFFQMYPKKYILYPKIAYEVIVKLISFISQVRYFLTTTVIRAFVFLFYKVLLLVDLL